MMPELIYSHECPYCRRIAMAVNAIDRNDDIRLTDIDSERGKQMIEDHHGEYIHAPHLFTEELVYYGVGPTARGLAKHFIKRD